MLFVFEGKAYHLWDDGIGRNIVVEISCVDKDEIAGCHWPEKELGTRKTMEAKIKFHPSSEEYMSSWLNMITVFMLVNGISFFFQADKDHFDPACSYWDER